MKNYQEKYESLVNAFTENGLLDIVEASVFSSEIMFSYPEELKQLIIVWVKTGNCPQDMIKGLSIPVIQDTLHVNLVMAFRFMNFYLKSPYDSMILLNAYARRNK